ncbi:MAG: HEPN domain-containing protein [Deltaproteobacteria bacterium]|nr:HEPN domain-containing protein [Deltaproteobacteria bacterium]
MNVRPEIVHEVFLWVEKAEHDLTAAKHNMQLVCEGLAEVVCFHSQQCVEKYLKGILVLHGISYPRTHDLRVLLDLACHHTALDLPPDQVLPLNRYSIEGRYPGNWDPITEEEASGAVEMARRVRDRIRSLLPDEILKGNT